jgi:iron complex outermembrane receptor protein
MGVPVVQELCKHRKKLNGIDFGPTFGELNIANFNEPLTYGVSAGLKW